MDSQRVSKKIYFNDIYSSGYLAFKFSSMMILMSFAGAAGAEFLAIVCVLLALTYMCLDRFLSVEDNGWLVLMSGGVLTIIVAHLFSKASSMPLLVIPVSGILLFYVVYSLAIQPFANLYAKVDGIPILRLQHTRLWLTAFFMLLIAALVLTRGGACWASLILSFTALGGHVYLQLFSRGKHWQPLSTRNQSEFKFVKVPANAESLKPIYDLFVKELSPAFFDGSPPTAVMVANKMRDEVESWKQTVFFAAYHEQRLVGTFSCRFDTPGDRLPFEKTKIFKADLDSLRKIGAISEFGKFSIDEEYRLNPEIFAGLLICASEEVLSRHIPFIAVQAEVKTSRIYNKMGFTQLTKEPAVHGEGFFEVHLLVKNLAIEDKTPNRLIGNIEEYISPYVFYRFVWRQILNTVIATMRGKLSPAALAQQELSVLATLS